MNESMAEDCESVMKAGWRGCVSTNMRPSGIALHKCGVRLLMWRRYPATRALNKIEPQSSTALWRRSSALFPPLSALRNDLPHNRADRLVEAGSTPGN